MALHLALVLLVLEAAAQVEQHLFGLPHVAGRAVEQPVLEFSSFDRFYPKDAIVGGVEGSHFLGLHGCCRLQHSEGAERAVEGQWILSSFLSAFQLLLVLLDIADDHSFQAARTAAFEALKADQGPQPIRDVHLLHEYISPLSDLRVPKERVEQERIIDALILHASKVEFCPQFGQFLKARHFKEIRQLVIDGADYFLDAVHVVLVDVEELVVRGGVGLLESGQVVYFHNFR